MRQKGMGAIEPFTASLIVMGINTAIGVLFNRKNGKQKEVATQIVNDAAQELSRVVATWEQTEPKTQELQQQFLGVVLSTIDQAERLLLDPALGAPGKRGWEERINTWDPITGQGQRGTQPEWDWWKLFYDPIASSTVTVSPASSNMVNSLFGGGSSGGISPIVLIGGAGILVWYLMQEGN